MTTPLNFPTAASCLPDLTDFVTVLAQQFEAGSLNSWQEMTQKVQTFFTTERMAQVDAVIPGWQKMSTYADGLTLTHVMCVFTGLLLSPEYKQAAAGQQELMKWIVLLHDLAKVAKPGIRDHTHGFRSAVMAAKILPGLGFDVTPMYPMFIEPWAKFTATAITRPNSGNDDIQDNRKLPEIIMGIKTLFDHHTPAALVVTTVLLHMSLNVVDQWPQSAALSNTEIQRYITPNLYPLLKMMMLADNDGWEIFDPSLKAQYRQETLAAFDAVSRIINTRHS